MTPVRLLVLLALPAASFSLGCTKPKRETGSVPDATTLTVAASPAADAAPSASAPAAKDDRESCIILDANSPIADGPPVTLEGTLKVDTAFPSRPFILQLTAARCVSNAEDVNRAAEVQLAPDGVNLRPLIGKRVRVVDGRPFHAHTGSHLRDVVVTTKQIAVLP